MRDGIVDSSLRGKVTISLDRFPSWLAIWLMKISEGNASIMDAQAYGLNDAKLITLYVLDRSGST